MWMLCWNIRKHIRKLQKEYDNYVNVVKLIKNLAWDGKIIINAIKIRYGREEDGKKWKLIRTD